ncbi:MAG: UDP-N-acetylenolpyruvoylglucosamine reductase [Paenibacillus sp. RIFOXYA1_FULL_44_5]|nr:MAG: UDP-N-acetylenolpyruvoylglucosamine reductase [Paenibacillus sp. RIFOXYA1_FULL_44_5]
MQQLLSALQEAQVGEIRLNEPMADYTTWKIGGPADIMIEPSGVEQLQKVMQMIGQYQAPWLIIGRGSNMLISDKGIRGVVIHLNKGFDHVAYNDDGVTAGAAFSLIKLCVLAGKQGLTGLEFASGIPGTVGGAVYMNAGAHGSDLSRILKHAVVVRDTGELVTMKAEDFQYAYRYSVLQDHPGIVVEAVLHLTQGDRREIAAAMAAYRDRRLRTQPFHEACGGSTFRNPEHHYAAKLIEDAGLKGMRAGGAEISMKHANFIVNTGQATARDVLTLMELMKQTVQEKYSIELVPEVLVVGER